jgi:hypothetical protein
LALLAKNEKWKLLRRTKAALCVVAFVVASSATVVVGQFVASDPGVRGGTIDSGKSLDLTPTPGAADFFKDGLNRFVAVEGVSGQPNNNGLGPRYNTNQCASCHAQPAVGGTSPSTTAFPFIGPNPETLVAN